MNTHLELGRLACGRPRYIAGCRAGYSANRRVAHRMFMLLLAFSVLLLSCGGLDGDDGEDGKDGSSTGGSTEDKISSLGEIRSQTANGHGGVDASKTAWVFQEKTIVFSTTIEGSGNLRWSWRKRGQNKDRGFGKAWTRIKEANTQTAKLTIPTGERVGAYEVKVRGGGFTRRYDFTVRNKSCPAPSTSYKPATTEDLKKLVSGAGALKGKALNAIDTSQIVDLGELFMKQGSFDDTVGCWDVSNVTGMDSMFLRAHAFNQDIGDWDTSLVQDMSYMFSRADTFNKDIGRWDVGRVTNMEHMFSFAVKFNKDIGKWDVGRVTDMSNMFEFAEDFNEDIGKWNVSKVEDMSEMFVQTEFFNQDIGGWDVSSVTNMRSMFVQALGFNQDLSRWKAVAPKSANTTTFSYNANPAWKSPKNPWPSP